MISILAMIPIAPDLNPLLQDKARELISASAVRGVTSGAYRLDPFIYTEPMAKLETDSRPWSRVSRVRNRMLEVAPWRDYDALLWIDSDVVDYAPEMPFLMGRSSNGCSRIVAPLVLVEDSMRHFGHERAYDFAACILPGTSHVQPENRWKVDGRNLTQEPPYWPAVPVSDVVEMDCAGTVMFIPRIVYERGARHADHPAFTDWWPVCDHARRHGVPTVIDRRVIARHANLPSWGIPWH